MGNGVTTTDKVKASNDLLNRDHPRVVRFLKEYGIGTKLGAYFVPPMFFGSNPEVLNLDEYLEKTQGTGKHKDGVRGQIAEQIMFNALKKHYEKSGDDVLIVQSHKFLNSVSSNEKDFLLVNVTKGYTMALEVKASASQYQTAKKQLFDAKDRIEELYAAIGLTKGQLISEAIFLDFKSPKKQTKCFEGFLPKPLNWIKFKSRHITILVSNLGYLI